MEEYNPTDDASALIGLMLSDVDFTDDDFVELVTARTPEELLELVAVLSALSSVMATMLSETTGGTITDFLYLVREIDVKN